MSASGAWIPGARGVATALLALVAASSADEPAGKAGSAAEFLPLEDGASFTYEELSRGLAYAKEEWAVRVVREGVFRVKVRLTRNDSLSRHDAKGRRIPTSSRELFFVTSEGVARSRGDGVPGLGDYLLRNPIAEGTSWGDERNRCRITAVGVKDTALDVTYEGCVEVTCESGTPPVVRVVSRYARRIGLVSQRVLIPETLPLVGPTSGDARNLGDAQERSLPVQSLLVLVARGLRGSAGNAP